MARTPEIDRVLDQGVQIPKTNSVNWDIPVNENWELLNLALKRKYDKDSPEEQIIQGARTTVLNKFRFTETIDGTITDAQVAGRVNKDLIINETHYNGVSQQSFELVEKSDVQNTANHIPRYTEEGHLLLPSGIEIW